MNHWWKAPIVTYESDGGETIMVRRYAATAGHHKEPNGNIVVETRMVVERVSREPSQ